MAEVGIRELRDNLSRYLAAVREGDELVITEHGRAIARIIPLDAPRKLDQLIAEGLVTPAASTSRWRPRRRISGRGTASDLVAEQRR